MKKIMIVAALSLLSVGCAGVGHRDHNAPPEKATVAAKSPTAHDAQVMEDKPDLVGVDEIDCSGEYYPAVAEAWSSEHELCEATLSGSELSATEKKAVQAAYGDESYLDGLATLYGICAQSGSGSWDYLQQAGSDEQLKEVRGALQLCPNHPDKDLIEKLVGGAKERNDLEDQGRVFDAGVYRVGTQIQPGTYYATEVEGCYWERTDGNGEAIDNNFVTAAKRVQVTIHSTDFSFNSTSCGRWQPVSN
ncbi:hypothetical protein [Streptomyces sp. NPDC001893]|uniref:hypothetical protein n=1 Tax=Streptomyces sp. NPDC001893 TaxID=3154530 RepID=UPI0033187FE8